MDRSKRSAAFRRLADSSATPSWERNRMSVNWHDRHPISSLGLWFAPGCHGKFSRRLGWQSICSIAVAALSLAGHCEGLAAAQVRSEELAITSPLDCSNGPLGMGE